MNTRILASLLVIGVVGAFATGSTFALFNDTEESSGNTFTAGAVDLQVDWNESYNGEHIQTVNLTDNPGAIFELDDVKPGDEGEATVSLHVFSNPAWMWMRANQTVNAENSCVEPEEVREEELGLQADGCGDEGELGENLNFLIWYDEDGDNLYDETDQDDGQPLPGGEEIIFNGTADELDNAADMGIRLDGDRTVEDFQAYQNSTTQYIGIKWWVPLDVGNEVQTDSKEFDFEFFAEQERNNPEPDNPFMEVAQ